jgi:diacylglycerol O-acyltransferase / wax synthase
VATIDRAGLADLALLAIDAGSRLPEHLGAVLVLDPGAGFDVEAACRVLAERAHAVPRLRQRLVWLPPGLGRPVWVDDPDLDPARHVRVMPCPAPGDERALLDLAAAVALVPLPRSRPRWAALLVPGVAGGRVGLVLVLHHVLADGVGGIGVLARLADGAGQATGAFPRPRPSIRQLAADAASSRLRRLARWIRRPERSRAGARVTAHSPAVPCSLLRPTGPRRRLATARVDLAALRDTAHRHGGTVNDALLAAVAGALRVLLAHRGETVEEFRIGVMVAEGAAERADAAGNRGAPLIVDVPATGSPAERVRCIAGVVRAQRGSVAGRPTAGVPPALFAVLARLGLYRLYMRHQRRLHTLVSNVRGPRDRMSIAGAPVAEIIPFSVGETGNLTVHVVALSYADTVVVTLVADPDRVPDLPVLATATQAELDALQGRSRCAGTGVVLDP